MLFPVPRITSRQHAIVKAFRLVARGDKSRALLDGWHLLHEAVQAGIAIETIALSGEPAMDRDAALVDRLRRRSDVSVVVVSATVMDAISPVRTPAGVVALARRPVVAVSQLLTPSPALVIVAIDIQDPGNAGAIVRSAEAGGATGVVFAGDTADAWGWKALRAAMGSTFRLPVFQQRDVHEAAELLRSRGVRSLATVPDGATPMHEADLRQPTALLIGAEGSGLAADVLSGADGELTIPMQRPVESLNVAVAAGVLVYEARRQRTTNR